MSKAKKNVVDPENIIEQYGADTARWFMLSDTPPERDIEWTEAGVEGAWRFTQRLWRIINDANAVDAPDALNGADDAATQMRRATHQALKAVSDDISQLRFNRAIARIYELSNTLGQTLKTDDRSLSLNWAIRESATTLVQMFAPMMPHLAEECWKLLGKQGIVAEAPWPQPIEELLVDDSIVIPFRSTANAVMKFACKRVCLKKRLNRRCLSWIMSRGFWQDRPFARSSSCRIASSTLWQVDQ